MKTVYWLPVAALAGIVVGAWGSHEELDAYQNLGKTRTEHQASQKKPAGFDAFAQMVKIPDAASRRPKKRPEPQSGIAATNRASIVRHAATGEVAKASASRPRPPRDLGARIEEAREIWKTRVDIALSQWKAKLKLSGQSEEAFDGALREMNDRLYDSVSALADIVREHDGMTAETGFRLLGETATIMAEAYDRIGECVAPELRGTVSEINMVDFIDPSVAEPLVDVQNSLEPPGRRAEKGGR